MATFDLLTGTPIQCPQQRVLPEWIDYNGHMNMAFYSVAFDRGVDYVYDHLGIGADYVAKGGSVFILEAHIHYLQELSEGDPIDIRFQLLDWDSKRLHFFEEMYHAEDGVLAATSEQIAMHIDMNTRKAGPFSVDVQEQLAALMADHQDLPRPRQVGHTIGIVRKPR